MDEEVEAERYWRRHDRITFWFGWSLGFVVGFMAAAVLIVFKLSA
jgi:hypothetical protein